MPDAKPPRYVHQKDQPTVIACAVINGISEVATVQTLENCRVSYKKNAAGEHVVALIFPDQERR